MWANVVSLGQWLVTGCGNKFRISELFCCSCNFAVTTHDAICHSLEVANMKYSECEAKVWVEVTLVTHGGCECLVKRETCNSRPFDVKLAPHFFDAKFIICVAFPDRSVGVSAQVLGFQKLPRIGYLCFTWYWHKTAGSQNTYNENRLCWPCYTARSRKVTCLYKMDWCWDTLLAELSGWVNKWSVKVYSPVLIGK